VEILYLAYNRLEFTKLSMETMLKNTTLSLVDRVVIYDDGSTDGTLEYLRETIKGKPMELRETSGLGPTGILRHYVETGASEMFAKIDNDVMLPPCWLETCLRIMNEPSIDILGIESMYPSGNGAHVFEPSEYVGGIGMLRTRAFDHCIPRDHGRFGFTAWQDYHPRIVKGWIKPSLPVCLLNLVPLEPWFSFSRKYVANNWQRNWPEPYDESKRSLWKWWA